MYLKVELVIVTGVCVVLLFWMRYMSRRRLHSQNFVSPYFSDVNIPRVIYKTGPKPYDELPDSTKLLHREWLDAHPWLTMVYYDDVDALNFIRSHFDEPVVEAFMRLKPGAYRADLLRYCLLYEFGGIYSDLTQRLLVSLDTLIDFEKDTLVLTRDRYDVKCNLEGIQIAFMAAVPKLPVFKTAIDMIVYNSSNMLYSCSPLALTGPVLFRRALDKHDDIPYRMDIQQDYRNKYTFIKNRKKAVETKASNHGEVLNSKHYSTYWFERDVYDTSSIKSSPPCRVVSGVVVLNPHHV